MTSSTAKKGIPYSTGTDGINTVDDTMKAMAERLDLLAGEFGSTTINVTAADTTQSVRVNTVRDYSSVAGALGVMVTLDSNVSTSNTVHWWVTAPDGTGFTLNVRKSNTGNVTLRWLAIPNP